MDKQAFDLMMARFDNIDTNIEQVKGGMKGHNDRLTSLEETRTKQRTVMTVGSVFVTFFSTAISWVIAHVK